MNTETRKPNRWEEDIITARFIEDFILAVAKDPWNEAEASGTEIMGGAERWGAENNVKFEIRKNAVDSTGEGGDETASYAGKWRPTVGNKREWPGYGRFCYDFLVLSYVGPNTIAMYRDLFNQSINQLPFLQIPVQLTGMPFR